MSESEFHVRMGEYEVCTNGEVISSTGIGSCVAVCLYDDINGVGGVAHVMLPSKPGKTSLKYADNLIDALIEAMEEAGASRHGLSAKIFGGASLFSMSTAIGEKNVTAVKKKLADEGIEIEAEDTGGEEGRSIWLNCRSGTVVVGTPFGPTERY